VATSISSPIYSSTRSPTSRRDRPGGRRNRRPSKRRKRPPRILLQPRSSRSTAIGRALRTTKSPSSVPGISSRAGPSSLRARRSCRTRSATSRALLRRRSFTLRKCRLPYQRRRPPETRACRIRHRAAFARRRPFRDRSREPRSRSSRRFLPRHGAPRSPALHRASRRPFRARRHHPRPARRRRSRRRLSRGPRSSHLVW
jgi:hypothetical protein